MTQPPLSRQLSSAPNHPAQPKLVNLIRRVLHQPSIKDILEKGPSFGIIQKFSSQILMLVEVGIERVFYAMKWAKHAEDRRLNSDSPDGVSLFSTHGSCTESTEESGRASILPSPWPSFRNYDVQQQLQM